MIALNIIDLPFHSLVSRLTFDQLAPVGWLVVQKLAYLLWSDFDYSLRILSLAAGLGSVPLFFALTRKLLERWEGFAALFLFGLSPTAIQYSAMVKPYIFDALFSAAFLLVGVSIAKEGFTRSRILVLWLLILAAILFSFGGCLVAISTGVVLTVKSVAERQFRWTVLLAAAGMSAAALGAVIYVVSYSGQAATVARMTDVYWSWAFAPWPTSLASAAWYPHIFLSLAAFLFGVGLSALLLIVVGIFGFASRRWILALLLGPILVSLCASLAHLYPLQGRLQLSLLPPLAILAARGLGVVSSVPKIRGVSWRYAVMAAIGIFVGFGVAAATAREAAKNPPWAYEEVEPNLRILAAEWKPGDTVIVTPDAEKAVLLYSDKVGLRGLVYRRGSYVWRQPSCAARDLRNLPPKGLVWVLFYHDHLRNRAGERLLLDGLAKRGHVRAVGIEPGSRLFRVSVSRSLPNAEVAPSCSQLPISIDFRRAAAERRGLHPLNP